MELVGDGIVGVRRVGLTVVTDQIGFGEESASPTATRADFEGVHLQDAAHRVNLVLGVLEIAPLVTQPIDNLLLIATPKRGNIMTELVVRLHLVQLPPLFGIDLLQQQTPYAQYRLENKPNVFIIITFRQERREIVLLERLALPRAVTVLGVKAGTVFLAQYPAATGTAKEGSSLINYTAPVDALISAL